MAFKFLVNKIKSGRKYFHYSHADMLLKEVNKQFDEGVQKTAARQAHMFLQENLETIPEVDIDAGEFKYLMIDVIHREVNGMRSCKKIVRGYRKCKYHSDILDVTRKELQEANLDAWPKGGGKIIRNSQKRKLHIFGTSLKYGRADHKQAAQLLKFSFPYYKITYED